VFQLNNYENWIDEYQENDVGGGGRYAFKRYLGSIWDTKKSQIQDF
jgi:hypothetical protein